jgi:hypothetical protein
VSERAEFGRRPALRRLAELFALTAFAFVEPILDLTGRSPDFFLYRQPSIWQIRLLVIAIVLVPPLSMWVAEQLVSLVNTTAAKVLHLAFLAGLFAIVVIEVSKHLDLLSGIPLLIVSALVGIGLAVIAVRTTGLRQAMLYAAAAPLVFTLVFALTTPAGALVRPARGSSSIGVVAKTRPPIVFLFLDEFPLRALLTKDGHIDAKLYPNFARLQQKTTWYPNATGVSGWTPFAAPAMLTGRYPSKVLAPSYLAYPQNLFTLLGGSYDVKAYETVAELCPPELCAKVKAGRQTGFSAMARDTARIAQQIVSPWPAKTDPTQRYVESTTANVKAITDRKNLPDEKFRFDEADKNQPTRLTSFLAELKPTKKPTLHFLHLLLPHAPYQYLPSLNAYPRMPDNYVPRRPGEDSKEVPLDPVLADLAKQRLLLQLGYTDRLIGELLDRLEQTRLLDQALLMVTADHGNGLTPGSRARERDEHNDPNLTWVPLFVKAPRAKGGKVDRRNEQHVDLLPTIADVLDVRIPWHVDGISMLGPPRTTPEKRWYDVPGELEHVDLAQAPTAHTGFAPEIARPELGVDGLYAIGPYRTLIGKPVSALSVGAPATMHARLSPVPDLVHVNPDSGTVPAMLWGRLDAGLGAASTYLVASVNGTIAGTIPALLGGDGTWWFAGMVNDRYFKKGRAVVTLYRVDGTTLHAIPWAT